MSSTPAAKRRRVEAANATLRQPFRSPVVRGPAKGGPAGTSAPKRDPDIPAAGPTTREREPRPTPRKAPGPKSRLKTSKDEPTFVWSSSREEFEEKNAALEEEIARLREEPEYNKEDGTRDELDGLIVKWRGAAQQAADELFEASRSRVESMGGMKELAAMRRRQAEFFSEEIAQSAPRGPVSDDGFVDEEARESREEDEEKAKEEEEYTMATMLRSLNIELDVIGYDAGEECWK